MTVKFRPLADRVLIKTADIGESKSEGGILLPGTAKELVATQEGEIIEVGGGAFLKDGSRQTMELKKGDRVMLGTYSGSTVKIEGQQYMVAKESEILGVLESV